MSEVHMGGWSDEECLLGYDKYVSNTHFNDYDDLPGISSDKDVSHEHPRMMRLQNYLGKGCYHHIECTIANFLIAFMLRRPLNSIALATTTHRKTRDRV